MLVRDLIELLEGYDADMEVHFSYNYGDHWHTQVAPTVDTVEEGMVKHSTYHSMDKMVDEEEFDYDDNGEPTYGEEVRRVVVLG